MSYPRREDVMSGRRSISQESILGRQQRSTKKCLGKSFDGCEYIKVYKHSKLFPVCTVLAASCCVSLEIVCFYWSKNLTRIIEV